MEFPQGKPVLLDHNGRPIRTRDGEPTPNLGGMATPHGIHFIARYGGANNTYWHTMYDEAVRHSREDADAMRRDCSIMALVEERQRAVSGLNWHLEVPDEKDKFQIRVKDGLTRIIKPIQQLRQMLDWWLEALWYGRFAVQIAWDWTTFRDRDSITEQDDQPPPMPGMPPPQKKFNPGKTRRALTVVDAQPHEGDKIGHQYDHTPYLLIHGTEAEELDDAEIINTTQGRALRLAGTWRERFIIHRHLREDAGFFMPEHAEAIHGVGIRSKIFWLNWLKMEWLANISDFFDRVGLGLTIWKYQAGNKQALEEVRQAATDQSNRAHILMPTSFDQGKNIGAAVERVEVPTSGAAELSKLMDYIDKSIERYIIGQEASAASGPSGIGNQAATNFQRSTKTQIAIQDAQRLAATLTGNDREPGLVNMIKKYTYPEADFPVWWVFDVDRGESQEKLQAAKILVEMGVSVKADEIRAAAGFGKPASGDEIIDSTTIAKAQQAMQPPQPMMPGQPGMPGADPNDPMAALAGMTGGEQPPEVEEQPEGDLVDALRM